MHTKNITAGGKNLKDADKVLILVHGRGGNAVDVLTLASHLKVEDFALLAPEATNNTWYPFSFMASPQQNEPWLSSALENLEDLVTDITAQGIDTDRIYLLGFSQGACLTLEFVTRHATRFGGVVAFTGGLIGDKIYREHYSGDFKETPIFLAAGDPDSHVPVERVHETAEVLREMNALVTEKIYPGKGHNISRDELENANRLIFEKASMPL